MIAVRYAYAHVQRLLTIAGLSISVLIFLISLCLKNPYLGDRQTLDDAEGYQIPDQAMVTGSVSGSEGLPQTGTEKEKKGRRFF